MKTPLERIVPAPGFGKFALDFLMGEFPSYRREDWLEAAASGRLLADGERADFNAVAGVARERRYVFEPPPPREPPIDDSYCFVYEDEHIAVVNKSGNLPCHPAGSYREHSLSRLLVSRNGFAEAFMVNRLDRETSGLVLAAKTAEAASQCGRDLMAGLFGKSYVARVAGCWTLPREFTASGAIRLERGEIVRKKRVFELGSSEGQACVTIFKLMETDAANGFSLLQAKPVTGRPHQIRATLKALGYPVAGDKLYGPDETIYARLCGDALTPADLAALRGFPRQCLHSHGLSFPHPFTRASLAFTAPAPRDMDFVCGA